MSRLLEEDFAGTLDPSLWTLTDGTDEAGYVEIDTVDTTSCTLQFEESVYGDMVWEWKFKIVSRVVGSDLIRLYFSVRDEIGNFETGCMLVLSYEDMVINVTQGTGDKAGLLTVGDYYWLKVESLSDKKAQYSLKLDGGSYAVFDTTTVSVFPTIVTDKCLGRIQMTGVQPGVVHLDHHILTSSYSDVSPADSFGYLSSSYNKLEELRAAIYSGWGLILHSSVEDAVEYPLEPQIFEPYPTINYDHNYSDNPYIYVGYDFASNPDAALRYLAAGDGHLIATFISNSVYKFRTLFKVNGVEVEFGKRYEEGVYEMYLIIDGVVELQQSHSIGTDRLIELTLSIFGNTLKLDYQDSVSYTTWTGGGNLYTDSNFLGSPAEYVYDFFHSRPVDTTHNSILVSLDIFIENSTPPSQPTNNPLGYLDGVSFQEFDSESSGVLTFSPGTKAFMFYKSSVSGGTDSLDNLDPTDLEGKGQELLEDSIAFIITDTDDMSAYVAVIDNTAVYDPPNVIIPTINPGDWCWKLIRSPMLGHATVTQFTDVLDGVPQVYSADLSKERVFPVWWNSGVSKQDIPDILFAPTGNVSGYGIDLNGDVNILKIPYVFDHRSGE